jgi:glycosyltransferase involved in cell wall biosynthesis
MRVLELLEPADGGVAEHVTVLSQGLHERGWDVELAGPPQSAVYPGLAERGIPIHLIHSLRTGFGRPASDARALAQVTRLLARKRYDVLHCHSAKAGVLGRLAGGVIGTPVVFSPHAFSFVGDFSERRRRFATAVERWLSRLTACLICVCEHERALADQYGLRCPARVVYSGTPTPTAQTPVTEELADFAQEDLLVASLAALRPQKTIEVLIDAAPEILRRVPNARIAIIGNGPLRDQLASRARERGLIESARFSMMAFHRPSGQYLPRIDVYVLPSAWEAFPIGVLEAQAYGVPQVATDVGGTAEAVTPEVGILIPPHDPHRLAEAVVTLLADARLRSSMATASRHQHATRFSVDRMVAETASVYEDVGARPKRCHCSNAAENAN